MSQFSKLKAALTPKSGGTVLAFVLAFLLELLMRLGKIALWVLVIALVLGLGVAVVYVAHRFGLQPTV